LQEGDNKGGDQGQGWSKRSNTNAIHRISILHQMGPLAFHGASRIARTAQVYMAPGNIQERDGDSMQVQQEAKMICSRSFWSPAWLLGMPLIVRLLHV
jgi:hypothetical protein